MRELSYTQFVVLQSICIFTSFLSIVGSSLIVASIFRQQRQKNHLKKNTLHQLLLGLSVSDIICTLVTMTFSLTNPRQSVDAMPWAIGNQITCSFTGFLYILFSTAANFYNMFMSIHFWRSVTRGKKRAVESQSTKRKDRWFRMGAHFVAIFVPLLFGIAGIITNSFHPHDFVGFCYFSEYPHGCDTDPTLECEGGMKGKLLGRLRTALVSVVALISITFTMILTIHVWRNIGRSKRYSLQRQGSSLRQGSAGLRTVQQIQSCEFNVTSGPFSTMHTKVQENISNNNNKQRAVAEQAVFYMLAYLNSFLFIVVAGIVVNVTDARENPGSPGPYALLVSLWFAQPLQGALNFIVFVRPRYKAWKNYFEKQQQRDPESNPATIPPRSAMLKKAILEQAPSFRQPPPVGREPPHNRCTNTPKNVPLQPIPCPSEESVSITASASSSRGVQTNFSEGINLSTKNVVDDRGKAKGLHSDKEVRFQDADDVAYIFDGEHNC